LAGESKFDWCLSAEPELDMAVGHWLAFVRIRCWGRRFVFTVCNVGIRVTKADAQYWKYGGIGMKDGN